MGQNPIWYNQCTCGVPTLYGRLYGGYHDKICATYLDDVIVYAKMFHQHVENLWKVLHRLHSKGIKLKPKKCKLFQKEVKYLGCIVSAGGYRVDPKTTKPVEALQYW